MNPQPPQSPPPPPLQPPAAFAASPPPPSSPRTSGLAIWSLVLGLISLLCLPFLPAIPAVICGHVAISKIKRSRGTLEGSGLAIAGLVTGYLGLLMTVVLIPLLAAIAIPNFVKARASAQANACILNLRHIEAAKEAWALEKQKSPQATPTEADLLPYLDEKMPTCPAGGQYMIGRVDEEPVCSIPSHFITRR